MNKPPETSKTHVIDEQGNTVTILSDRHAPPEEIPPEPANEMIAQQFAEMQAARRRMMGA